MERTITKKRAALWVVATIVGPLLLYWFASGWYIGVWYARTGHQGPPLPDAMVQAMMIGLPPALWGTVILWWAMHRRRAHFSELYNTRSKTLEMDLTVGALLGALWVLAYGLVDVVSWSNMFLFGTPKLASVPASISAGFCEEFLYRGFLFWIIAAAGGGNAAKVVAGSLAFGLAHCFWGPWGMAWATVLGVTFGLIVLWRGSVWPAVVAHTLLDLCIEPGLINKALHGGF